MMNKNKILLEEFKYSWKIERENLSYDQLQKIIKIYKKYEKIFKQDDFQFSVSTICDIHRDLFNDGHIRSCDVWIGGRKGVSPEILHFHINEFVNIVNDADNTPLTVLDLHAKYEMIHPFIDGNGRSGRFLIPLLCIYLGLEPLFISKRIYDNLDGYYKSLSYYTIEGFGPMYYLDYFNKLINDEN